MPCTEWSSRWMQIWVSFSSLRAKHSIPDPILNNTLHLVQIPWLMFVELKYKLQRGSRPLRPTDLFHLLMLFVEYFGSGTVRWRLAGPGEGNYGCSPNLELPETHNVNMETEVWEFIPLGWLFHFWREQCTLSTDGKIVLNFRIHLGSFLTPALETQNFPHSSAFSSPHIKHGLSLGGFPLLTMLNSKLICHLCHTASWEGFPFQGWDSAWKRTARSPLRNFCYHISLTLRHRLFSY